MTVESERQISEMHTDSRMELGCEIISVESKSKICRMYKRRRTQVRNNDC